MNKLAFDPSYLGKVILSPEIIFALAAIILFSATIVQPESILPAEVTADPGRKDTIIYTPEILKAAEEIEPAKLLAAGKPGEAVTKATELAQSRPLDVLSNLGAGNVLYKVGNKDESFRLLKRSVALAPKSRFVRLNLAERLAEDKRNDEAIAQFKLISAAYPHWSKPRQELADIYLSIEQPAAAAEELRLALESEPNNGALRKTRGLALARSGDIKEGLQEYLRGDNTELTSGPPADVKQLIAQWGSLERVIFELEKELHIRPQDPMLKYRHGRVLMYTGQINEAKAALIDARKRAPANPEIHRTLALVLQRLGDTNLALSEFTLSINLERSQERPAQN